MKLQSCHLLQVCRTCWCFQILQGYAPMVRYWVLYHLNYHQKLEQQALVTYSPMRWRYWFTQGAYGNALTEYMAGYHTNPEEPLCLLCIGVTHLNQAVTRKVPNRDASVLAAFAFLQVRLSHALFTWPPPPPPFLLPPISPLPLLLRVMSQFFDMTCFGLKFYEIHYYATWHSDMLKSARNA